MALILALFVLPVQQVQAASWWDTDWQYRNVLSFNMLTVNEDFTNWPVLVTITPENNFDFSKLQADGDDIRFIDSDDLTELPYYLEVWDYAGEFGLAWVKVPLIEKNTNYSDYIYIYYGNDLAANNESPNDVYTADYVMVPTYKDSTGILLNDATVNGNDGTITGATWTELPSGLWGINHALNSGNNVNHGHNATLDLTTNFTNIVWVKKTAQHAASYPRLIGKGAHYGFSSSLNDWKISGSVYDNAGHYMNIGPYFDASTYTFFAYSVGADGKAFRYYFRNSSTVTASGNLGFAVGSSPLTDVKTSSGGATMPGFESYLWTLAATPWTIIQMTNYFNQTQHLFDGSAETFIYYGNEDPPPTLSTLTATDITTDKDGVTGGTFRGNLESLGGSPTCNVWFEYGLTDLYGNETTHVEVNTTGIKTAAVPNNLTPGTTYHYRFVGENVDGETDGADETFTFTTPTITTLAATNVIMNGGTHSTLGAQITNMGVASDTYVFFQWGYDTTYGNTVGTQTVAGVGTYTFNLTGYHPEKTVHYRAGVRNGAVEAFGTDQSFKVTPTNVYNTANMLVLAFAIAAVVALFVVLYMIVQGAAALPLLIMAAILSLIAVIGISIFVSLVQGLW